MAAELEQWIQRYREQGLEQAADTLDVVKADLLTQGLIPKLLFTLHPLPKIPNKPPFVPAPPASWQRQNPAEAALLGRRRKGARGEKLDVDQEYEIDHLGLPLRRRNALLRWGIGTIATVQTAIEEGWLPHIYQITEEGAKQITETVRHYQLSHPDEEPLPKQPLDKPGEL